MDDLTRQFLRFREHADVAALGAVFDASAGRLLSLALQLCGNPSDAEDLLQATFVLAMQKAPTFDASKPLLPWLCGILAGEASNLRRGAARHRSEPLPELIDDATGPLAHSERVELLAALRSHVEQLPDDQRQVLLLQLQHGLSPTAIAEVLGAAPGTVRMRIHRGLAALRRLLPAGLAALLVGALPSRGLAAVRLAVLQQAQLTLRTAVVGGGALLVKKVVAVAAFLLVCALAWFTLQPAWQRDAIAPTNDRASLAVAARPAPDTQPITGPDTQLPLERDAAALPTAALATPTAATTGALHVRLLNHDDGSPGAITKVSFTPRRHDTDDRIDSVHAHTDGNGECTLRGLPVGDAEVHVEGDSRQRVTITADATTELLLRVNWRGLPARGRVVHANGKPAAGASIVLGTNQAVDIVSTSAEDGTFALAELYPYEMIGAVLAGCAPSLLQSLQPRREIELVLPGPAVVLEGKVVDPVGAPIANAHVAVGSRTERTQWKDARGFQLEVAADQRMRTGLDGAFRFELTGNAVRLDVTATGFAPFADIVEPGTTQLVQLQSGAAVHGRVVDQRATPVADASVSLGGSNGTWRRTDADGRFAFESAPRGHMTLRVEGDSVEPLDAVRDAEGPGEWQITVQRRPQYPLRLVDDLGNPLAGWMARATTLHHALRTTAADGRVTLIAPVADRGRIELRTPSGSLLAADWPAGSEPDVEATLVVPRRIQPNAIISGRVLDAAGQPIASGRVDVRRVDLPGQHMPGAELVAGAFTTDAIAAGDYELVIHVKPSYQVVSDRIAVRGLQPDERRVLADHRLPATGQLAFHLVHRDRVPIVDPSVFVFDERGEESRAPSTDGDPKPWPVGRYRYRAMVEGTLWLRGDFEVMANRATVVELLLQPAVRRHIRFPVPTPAWGAVTKVHYVLRQPDGGVYDEDDFDPREELPMSFAPSVVPGTWLLELTTDLGQRFAGSFTVEDLSPRAEPIAIEVHASR